MATSVSGRYASADAASVDARSRVVEGRANWLAANDPRLELNARQYTAVLGLASHDKVDAAVIDDAAHRAGVTPGRVRRWLRASYFRRALAKERAEPAGYGFRLLATEDGPRAVSEARQSGAASLDATDRRALSASHEGADDE
jgi:hypothetical protein